MGINAVDAAKSGTAIDSYTATLQHNDRAILEGDDESGGFVTVHCAKGTDTVCGCTGRRKPCDDHATTTRPPRDRHVTAAGARRVGRGEPRGRDDQRADPRNEGGHRPRKDWPRHPPVPVHGRGGDGVRARLHTHQVEAPWLSKQVCVPPLCAFFWRMSGCRRTCNCACPTCPTSTTVDARARRPSGRRDNVCASLHTTARYTPTRCSVKVPAACSTVLPAVCTVLGTLAPLRLRSEWLLRRPNPGRDLTVTPPLSLSLRRETVTNE